MEISPVTISAGNKTLKAQKVDIEVNFIKIWIPLGKQR